MNNQQLSTEISRIENRIKDHLGLVQMQTLGNPTLTNPLKNYQQNQTEAL